MQTILLVSSATACNILLLRNYSRIIKIIKTTRIKFNSIQNKYDNIELSNANKINGITVIR